MPYKAIIFDFFGVISSEVAPLWFRAHFSPEKTEHLKDEYIKDADRGMIPEKELMEKLAKLSKTTPSEIERDWFSRAVINQDVVKEIKRLKKNYKIGLCSNAVSSFLRTILKKNNLEKLFDAIIISSEVKLAKPDQEIYNTVLKALSVEPKDAFMIDDVPEYIEAAEKLGINGLAFKSVEQLKLL